MPTDAPPRPRNTRLEALVVPLDDETVLLVAYIVRTWFDWEVIALWDAVITGPALVPNEIPLALEKLREAVIRLDPLIPK
jgi:hypothetical protein